MLSRRRKVSLVEFSRITFLALLFRFAGVWYVVQMHVHHSGDLSELADMCQTRSIDDGAKTTSITCMFCLLSHA